jgi:hypothetical protein
MWGEPGGDRILFAIKILYQKALLSDDSEAF